MTEENKNEDNKDDKDGEKKDFIDELLDGVDDETDDKSEDKDDKTGDGKDDADGEDDKPITVKDLEKILAKTGKGTDLEQFKVDMLGTMQEMLNPLIKNQQQGELLKSVSDFQDKVKKELPGFEVDKDMLEYHMGAGKTKKDALKIQVEAERKRADAYGYKKEVKDNDSYGDDGDNPDLEGFNPKLHKEDPKAFRKLPKEERNKYFTKLANFVRSIKKR